MSKGISISVSGGNVNFGNVAQGNGSKLNATINSTISEQKVAFAQAYEQLAALQQDGQSRQDVEDLKARLEQLEQSAKDSPWDQFVAGAKEIYQKYGWAGNLLKPLFAALIPGWLS